jgi:hypothetical protein
MIQVRTCEDVCPGIDELIVETQKAGWTRNLGGLDGE